MREGQGADNSKTVSVLARRDRAAAGRRLIPAGLLLACMLAVRGGTASAQPQQPDLRGRELSDSLLGTLSTGGFSVQVQDLTPSDSTSFPQNLIVTIPPAAAEPDKLPWYEASVDTVLFSFTQEFFAEDTELLRSLLEGLSEAALPYTATVLLSANDSRPALNVSEQRNGYHPAGSATYANGIRSSDTVCAVVFAESRRGTHTITPGGARDVAPRWLVQALRQTCEDRGIATGIPHDFFLLYKWGIMSGNARISAFIEQSIPAAGISIGRTEQDRDLVLAIAGALGTARSQRWDRHYTFVQIGTIGLWFGESYHVFLYLALGLFLLLRLSFSFFVQTPGTRALVNDVKRAWFLVPAAIAVTTLTLRLVQLAAGALGANPLLLAGLKLLAGFLVVFILSAVQIRTGFNTSFAAMGFHQQAMAAINVFLFSTLNINLFFLFLLEYALLSAARRAAKPAMLILMFVLPVVPFVPHVLFFLQATGYETLRSFVRFSVPQDVLLACLLLPFQLQWARLLIVLDVLSPQKAASRRRAVLHSAMAISVSTAILAAAYAVMSHVAASSNRRLSAESPIRREEREPSGLISVSYAQEPFMELTMREVMVEAEASVIRYDVSVRTEQGVPLYDSNYDYSFEGAGTVFFHIPDYPAGHIHIIYFTESDQDDHVTVGTYRMDGEVRGLIVHEETELTIPAARTGER